MTRWENKIRGGRRMISRLWLPTLFCSVRVVIDHSAILCNMMIYSTRLQYLLAKKQISTVRTQKSIRLNCLVEFLGPASPLPGPEADLNGETLTLNTYMGTPCFPSYHSFKISKI